MKIIVLYLIAFFFSFNLYAQIQLGADIDGEDAQNKFGFTTSISYDGSRVAIGAPYNSERAENAGHIRVFEWRDDNWLQLGLDIEGGNEDDYFGWTMALSGDGNHLIAGAKYFTNKQDGIGGYSRVFSWDGTDWKQMGTDIIGDTLGGVYRKYEVSISRTGMRIAIAGSRWGGTSEIGFARVYEWDGLGWTQIGQDITAIEEGEIPWQNIVLSDDGNTIAVGMPYYNENIIRVYRLEEGNWEQVGNRIEGITGGGSSTWWYGDVDISENGNHLIIGSPYCSGDVDVYRLEGENWSRMGETIDGDGSCDYLGAMTAISANGMRIAIGAPWNDGGENQAGQVQIFDWNGEEWIEHIPDIYGEAEDDRASWVDLSGDGRRVVIGATGNDGNGEDSGHARVFQLNTIVSIDPVKYDTKKTLFFPNPATKSITLNGIEQGKMEIFDILGRIVFSKYVTDQEFIDVSKFSKGEYLLYLKSDEGIIVEKLQIK